MAATRTVYKARKGVCKRDCTTRKGAGISDFRRARVISAVRFGEAKTLQNILATGRYSVNTTTGMSKRLLCILLRSVGTLMWPRYLNAGATVDAHNIDGWTHLPLLWYTVN